MAFGLSKEVHAAWAWLVCLRFFEGFWGGSRVLTFSSANQYLLRQNKKRKRGANLLIIKY